MASDQWILLAKHVHPIIHDAILQTAQYEGINPKNAHDVMTANQAVHLVSEMQASLSFSNLRAFDFMRKVSS